MPLHLPTCSAKQGRHYPLGVALTMTFPTPQPLIVVPDFATVGNAYCGTFHIKEVGGDYSPIVVSYFAAVGNAHCGTFPKKKGGYFPLSIVVLIHGGKGPRKVGQVLS